MSNEERRKSEVKENDLFLKRFSTRNVSNIQLSSSKRKESVTLALTQDKLSSMMKVCRRCQVIITKEHFAMRGVAVLQMY